MNLDSAYPSISILKNKLFICKLLNMRIDLKKFVVTPWKDIWIPPVDLYTPWKDFWIPLVELKTLWKDIWTPPVELLANRKDIWIPPLEL